MNEDTLLKKLKWSRIGIDFLIFFLWCFYSSRWNSPFILPVMIVGTLVHLIILVYTYFYMYRKGLSLKMGRDQKKILFGGSIVMCLLMIWGFFLNKGIGEVFMPINTILLLVGPYEALYAKSPSN